MNVERLESRELLTLTLNVGTNINIHNMSLVTNPKPASPSDPTNTNNMYAVSNTSRHYTMNGGATWLIAGG